MADRSPDVHGAPPASTRSTPPIVEWRVLSKLATALAKHAHAGVSADRFEHHVRELTVAHVLLEYLYECAEDFLAGSARAKSVFKRRLDDLLRVGIESELDAGAWRNRPDASCACGERPPQRTQTDAARDVGTLNPDAVVRLLVAAHRLCGFAIDRRIPRPVALVMGLAARASIASQTAWRRLSPSAASAGSSTNGPGSRTRMAARRRRRLRSSTCRHRFSMLAVDRAPARPASRAGCGRRPTTFPAAWTT
jgi:hypothetical protein